MDNTSVVKQASDCCRVLWRTAFPAGHSPRRIAPFVVLLGLTFVPARVWCDEYPHKEELNVQNEEELFQLPLNELLEVRIWESATLTATEEQLIPAAKTYITHQDILASGARSLNELLEMYVPGLQWIYHQNGYSNLGVRGIIADSDDKYLLRVNGKTMNERTTTGVVSERDLNLLADIHHIEIIRGPGSAVHGLGAVSMVISIVTFDALDDTQKSESRTRVGYGENFATQELRLHHTFTDDIGMTLYAGVSHQEGADTEDAPLVYGNNFVTKWDDIVHAGEPISFGVGRDKDSYRDREPYKIHGQLQLGDLQIWTRYTRGGESQPLTRSNLAKAPAGNQAEVDANNPYPPEEVGYQQFTLATEYNQNAGNWDLTYHASYDFLDFERIVNVASPSLGGPHIESYREDEYFARFLARWNGEGNHSFAIGMELSHEEFGLKSPGFPDLAPANNRYLDGMPRWSTDTYSLVLEHQWRITPKWTTFLSGRIDKNTYSEYLFSPRFALIFKPAETDSLKLLLNRSQRMNFASDLYVNHQRGYGPSDPEVLDAIELRWEHQPTKELFTALSCYYQDLDVIGSSTAERKSIVVGNQKNWGAEWELGWQHDSWKLTVSHAYAKLLDFELYEGLFSVVSVAPNGYGNDLLNWSNHISKLMLSYQFNSKWTAHGALQYYWGFQGIEDYVAFANATLAIKPFQLPGQNDIQGPNAYLQLGIHYAPNENISFGLNGYNLLGLFDDDLNKRNFNARPDAYRIQAPAIAVSMSFRF